MSTTINNYHSKKHKYRMRRNIVRKFLLVLTTAIVFYLSYLLYKLPVNKNVHIEVVNSKYSNSEYIALNIQDNLSENNFYLLSCNKLSEELLAKNKLIRQAIVRKFIFPKVSIVAYVLEKNICLNVFYVDRFGDKEQGYLLEDGYIIDPFYVRENVINKNLPNLYLSFNHLPSKALLFQLVDFYDRLVKSKINIKDVYCDSKMNLKILCHGGLLVYLGKLDETLYSKIHKLKESLAFIQENNYKVEYIDLSLENSAVVRVSVDGKIFKKEVIKTSNKDLFGRD